MKALSLILTLGLIVAGSTSAGAATKRTQAQKSKAGVKKAKSAQTGDLQTDVNFSDSVLHGEYQTPDEALAKVEGEKGLSDLVGVRKHFKDRLSKAKDQE